MALNINGTTGISGVDGSASAPALTGTDSNTGINFASDTVNINTGGSTRTTVDSSGRVLIGTTTHSPAGSYSDNLVVSESSGDAGISVFGNSSNSNYASLYFGDAGAQSRGYLEMQLGSNGNFTIGGNGTGPVRFVNNGAERMRIDSTGRVAIGSTSIAERFRVETTANTMVPMAVNDSSNTSLLTHRISIRTGGTEVGSIRATNSGTTYSTSSDYRLKENAVAISDGITRLKTLKPYRFNFKVDSSKIVDGFFAHEVTAVPEAVDGVKDEVATQDHIDMGLAEKIGDPIYQGIDQAKLVPLLTAALQEAIAKIEVLETKVAALEAG